MYYYSTIIFQQILKHFERENIYGAIIYYFDSHL